jgi:hypothetical protein
MSASTQQPIWFKLNKTVVPSHVLFLSIVGYSGHAANCVISRSLRRELFDHSFRVVADFGHRGLNFLGRRVEAFAPLSR